jgi:hypothetical protein
VRSVLVVAVALLVPSLHAQEGRLSITGTVGPSFLSFTDIDTDGQNDIDVYNRLGIPIGDYDPLRIGFSAEGGLEYRFDRDISLNVFVQYTKAGTNAFLSDTSNYLSLDRRLTSMDIGVDFIYYFHPLEYSIEPAFFIGIGRMVGRAEQTTQQSHSIKSADSTLTVVDQEAFASYKKTKLYVRVGGLMTMPVFKRVWLHARVLYKFAPLGELDGTLREFALVRPHTTTVQFDYSTIDVKLGLSYVFE